MNARQEPQIGTREAASEPRIAPVPYQAPGGTTAVQRWRPSRAWVAFTALGLLVALAATFFLFARSVQVLTTPADASVDVEGGIGISFGGGYLLLPGDYRVNARAEGYVPLQAPFAVGEAAQQTLRFELQRLPGKLKLIVEPEAEVFVDGNPRGRTPLDLLELSPGAHQLLLRAPRYQAHQAQIEIEGGGVEQTLRVQLKPGWAPVSLRSLPAGAEILIDGAASGRTPQTLELGAGIHELQLKLDGYATWRDTLTVNANEPLNLPEIKLVPAQGVVKISSTPPGASVSVGGAFRGQTPLELALKPGEAHTLKLSAPGHQPAERSLTLAANATQDLAVTLEPILGSVVLDIEPADAQVKVDGRALAPGSTRVELVAVAHKIEVTKAGHASWNGSVTPRPGFEQRVVVRLNTEEQARSERVPARISAKGGSELLLIQPGAFRMGTARGEQGRQTNEARRPVRLTRAFYLGVAEVSNAEFRRFKPDHSSGIAQRETLDNERQPVARVSWADAARYCNWLSQQNGLPAAYRSEGSSFALIQPVTTGYRLPSEAEWEWAARFAGGGEPRRYSWGAGFPPPPKSGNFADAQAQAANVAPDVLQGYVDGFAAAAPLRSFAPSALGLYDLGGNVSEWVHDVYDPALPINPPEAVDPFGPASGDAHVVRGSSWLHGRIVELRLAWRAAGSDAQPDLGFRVARYAE